MATPQQVEKHWQKIRRGGAFTKFRQYLPEEQAWDELDRLERLYREHCKVREPTTFDVKDAVDSRLAELGTPVLAPPVSASEVFAMALPPPASDGRAPTMPHPGDQNMRRDDSLAARKAAADERGRLLREKKRTDDEAYRKALAKFGLTPEGLGICPGPRPGGYGY